MKSILLNAALLSSTIIVSSSSFAEGVFIGGGSLFADSSIECNATFCGQVNVELEIDNNMTPINTNLDVAGEAFFNPNLDGFFHDRYITTLGVSYIDRDAIAAQYASSGFTLLTRSFENGVLPKGDTIEVNNVNFMYDEATNSVQLSFDWESETSPSIAFLQYGVYMNTNASLDDHLSSWKIEGSGRTTERRRVVVQSASELSRIDVHAIIDGEEYNFEMKEVYQNFYTWDFPPTVADNAEMDIFFNYTVNGVGVDTPHYEVNVGNLAEIYTPAINIFNDTITLTDQVIYPLIGGEPGELGFDSIKLEQATVSYKVNGGSMINAPMTRETIQNDGFRIVTGMQHTFFTDLKAGDEIEYSLYFVYEGVPYTTPLTSKSL